MSTIVRDAVVKFFNERPAESFFNVDDLAKNLKMNRDSTSSAARLLVKRKILERRRIPGSNRYEYGAGSRLSVGLKYTGRKFPFHKKNQESTLQPAPASAPTFSGLGLILTINSIPHPVSLSEARKMFEELKGLFGE